MAPLSLVSTPPKLLLLPWSLAEATPDVLILNMHFNKIPSYFVDIVQLEMHSKTLSNNPKQGSGGMRTAR